MPRPVDETVKAKKHIRIEHPELKKRKVELWLPIDEYDKTLHYNQFRNKVQDLLQIHLGPQVVLFKMKSKNGGRIIENETILNEEVNKGAVVYVETKLEEPKSFSLCGCF